MRTLRRDHLRRLPDGISTAASVPTCRPSWQCWLAYRLSKRQIQQIAGDLFGLSISTGMVSKLERLSAEALEAPYNELAISVHQAEVVNVDETSWRENRRKVWLWATVTKLATVFTIAAHRSRKSPVPCWEAETSRSSAAIVIASTSTSNRFGTRFVGRT